MLKKTIATVGLGVAAASAGALLLSSPASAETTHVSASANAAYVKATGVSAVSDRSHFRGDYRHGNRQWWHHYNSHFYGHRGWGRYHAKSVNRIVINNSNTNVAIAR